MMHSAAAKIESPDDVINFVYNAVGSLMSASDAATRSSLATMRWIARR